MPFLPRTSKPAQQYNTSNNLAVAGGSTAHGYSHVPTFPRTHSDIEISTLRSTRKQRATGEGVGKQMSGYSSYRIIQKHIHRLDHDRYS